MGKASDTLRRAALEKDGAALLPELVLANIVDWITATQPLFDLGKPGHRVSANPELARLAAHLANGAAFTDAVGAGWSCVRAIAFNKTPAANWALAWHQDRTIAVKRREAAPGFSIWSTKDGVPHVEPPFSVLDNMVTARVHLDPVDADNAPLLVARGSHRRGKVAESEIDNVVAASDIMSCHAEAGDVWLYATPILHASARSRRAQTGVPRSDETRNRRVIHLDLSRDTLPAPLEWAGIG